MKHWFLFPLLLLSLLLTSCHKDDEPQTTPYRRTVLVYLAADNNLSSFALEDLAEMKEGMAQVSDGMLHLLVYIDFADLDIRHFLRQLLNYRAKHHTRTTPARPKINEYRFI